MTGELTEERRLLRQLHGLKDELAPLRMDAELQAIGLGQGFGDVEGRLLYAMIRWLRPGRIMEVGGGVSTAFIAAACELNRLRDRTDALHRCVEPRPTPELEHYCQQHGVVLVKADVRDIDRREFLELGQNDLLFIDSSHVVKIDSDVEHLVLEVLPRLRDGVVVHIHDISFPRLTPRPDYWVFRMHQFWNEAALVKAFLSFNSAFEVLLCTSYLHEHDPTSLKDLIDIYEPAIHRPSSLWIRR